MKCPGWWRAPYSRRLCCETQCPVFAKPVPVICHPAVNIIMVMAYRAVPKIARYDVAVTAAGACAVKVVSGADHTRAGHSIVYKKVLALGVAVGKDNAPAVMLISCKTGSGIVSIAACVIRRVARQRALSKLPCRLVSNSSISSRSFVRVRALSGLSASVAVSLITVELACGSSNMSAIAYVPLCAD
jgi:hypothetical protein